MKPFVLYDSECALCIRFKKSLELIDKEQRVIFISVYDKEVYQKYSFLKQEECEDIVHLVSSDQVVYKGSQAIKFLINIYPQVSKFSWLLESKSSKRALDFFYDKVNDIRKSTKKSCRSCDK